jgi:hypothetical protein
MFVEKLINNLPGGLGLVKLILGGVLVGLLVSLGMGGILRLFGFIVDPALSSVLAGVAAGVYAAGIQRGSENVYRKK